MNRQTTSTGPSVSREVQNLMMALPLLSGVPADIRHELAVGARLSQHDKGEVLLRAGETAARLCVLTEGWACLRKGNAEGAESILHILQKHDLFPDLGSLHASLVDVEALTPVTLISFPLEAVRRLADHCSVLSANLRAVMERRMQDLLEHVEHLTLRDAEHRVGWFLLRLKLTAGGSRPVIDLPFEKTVIASYLGIKPETLSRVLAHFRSQGFVSQRDHMVMPHEQALCSYCDERTARDCAHGGTADCPYPPADPLDPI